MRDRLIELIDKVLVKYDRGCLPFVMNEIADHLIAHGVTVQEWISVKERLPETNEYGFRVWVVACVDGNKSCIRLFERTTVRGKLVERFKYPWETITYENITHWMPLPPAPKGE